VRPRLTLAVVSLVAVLAGLAGCQDPAPSCDPNPSRLNGQPVYGCLDAVDQTSDGTSATVAAVDIRGASGWIILHVNDGGEPGARAGLIQIRQGLSTNVVVPAFGRLVTGDYWPMLHLDAGVLGSYDFPHGPDVPVVDSQGIVMKLIHVTVR
jgi:hypothetical protein